MPKTIVCRCEDVLLEDLQSAFQSGFRDLESLKRFTGLGTGFCQGKSCLCHGARFLASVKGGDDVVSDPPRTRPPLRPTPLAQLAGTAPEPVPFAPAPGQTRKEHP
jgi:bacterioferritin-associated ferredoxin